MKNHMFFCRLFLKHLPAYFILFLLQNILKSISYILLLQYSVLIVVDGIGNGNIWSVMLQLIAIFLFSVGLTYTQGLLEYKWNGIAKERMENVLFHNIFDIVQNADLKHYETPELYDTLAFAKDMNQKAFESLACFASLAGCITGILGLSSLFLALSPIALIIVIITFVLSIVNRVLITKADHRYEIASVLENRKRIYLEKVFFERDNMNEVKLNSLKDFFLHKYATVNQEYRKQKQKSAKPLFALNGPADFFADFIIGTVAYHLLLVYQVVVTGTLSIGGYSALFFASTSLLGRLNEISFSMQNFGKVSLSFENMKKVLELRSELHTGERELPDKWRELSLQDVAFSYDNKKEILKNIHATIQAGTKIAIVGMNGGGKSTLVKLLLRLYDPTDGQITMDSMDIRLYELEAYRAQFGILFQNFNIYAAPLICNVAMDHISLDKAEEATILRAKKAINDAGFHWRSGVDLWTILNKKYDINGTFLSKGEQQKIGIARILFSDKKMIILDEPSASLDPEAEFEFNRKIQEYSKDKTLVMISHRLSTTRNADRIFVIDEGHIVEEGTHNELMGKGGYYANMFNLQASKFSDWKNISS